MPNPVCSPELSQRFISIVWAILFVLLVSALTAPAEADRLMIAPDSPVWMHGGAAILLFIHIGGGALGLASGAVAIAAPKGRPVHRAAGRVFFVSMSACYLVGAGVAPFLESGQRPNFVGGVLALYLLLSAWRAARLRNPATGWPEFLGLAAGLGIAGLGLLFMYQGAQSPTGTIDGSPPQAFILFLVTGSAAALGELHVIVRGRIEGVSRISRHLWRMCMSLFIASASFFLGQEQMLPDALVGSPLQIGAVIIPLLAIPLWLILSRLPQRQKKTPA